VAQDNDPKTDQGWNSPVVLALLANAVAEYFGGQQHREPEVIKAETAFVLEALTDDVEQSKANLMLLADGGLLSEKTATGIKNYIENQSTGEGPALICIGRTPLSLSSELKDALEKQVTEMRMQRETETDAQWSASDIGLGWAKDRLVPDRLVADPEPIHVDHGIRSAFVVNPVDFAFDAHEHIRNIIGLINQ